MIKLKNILTEAKELPQKDIDFIAIETLANMFNQMNELMKAREKLDKMLFTQAKRMYSNYDDIYGAF